LLDEKWMSRHHIDELTGQFGFELTGTPGYRRKA
jgi:hypothetical protein